MELAGNLGEWILWLPRLTRGFLQDGNLPTARATLAVVYHYPYEELHEAGGMLNHQHSGGEQLPRLDGHGHTHGALDRAVLNSQRGIWATKVSLAVLLATAAMQVVLVVITGSVALLADTIHNLSDAATALPLWAAFTLSRRPPSRRFTYGLGRAEDLAGLLIVAAILTTGIIAAFVSIGRLSDPPDVDFIWAVVLASVVGFLGNEAVALFRIKIGKEIGSAALVADGYHARVDGLTSLAVLAGAIGVLLGAPLADPIAGVAISVAIFRIVLESGKSVVSRLLDGVEPEVIDEVRTVTDTTEGVEGVTEIRVRWLGHTLLAEVNITVNPYLSVEEGHRIAQETHQRLLDRLQYLANATIHVDPVGSSGEEHHQVMPDNHGDNDGHYHEDHGDHADEEGEGPHIH